MFHKIRLLLLIAAVTAPFYGTGATSSNTPRKFIAHRGVNMRSTVAGENSLEAIGLSRRAGFDAIETDVRLTSDSVLVVMHDVTLNRTCLKTNGTPIEETTPVADVSFNDLRLKYCLKATHRQMQSRIPTLKEYLEECKRQGILAFIEPKIYDPSGNHYRKIMEIADEVLGHGNYIITSNNRANDVIRGMGIKDIRLMGIVYQTTFEHVRDLGNSIMALSATRIEPKQYEAYMKRSVAEGLETESHADKFVHFDRINRNPVNYVSTDFLAPDYRGQGVTMLDTTEIPGPDKMPYVAFGGAYLEITAKKPTEVLLGRQKFKIDKPGTYRHQVLLHEERPAVMVADEDAEVRLRIVEF